jgi:hypothetical protein
VPTDMAPTAIGWGPQVCWARRSGSNSWNIGVNLMTQTFNPSGGPACEADVARPRERILITLNPATLIAMRQADPGIVSGGSLSGVASSRSRSRGYGASRAPRCRMRELSSPPS